MRILFLYCFVLSVFISCSVSKYIPDGAYKTALEHAQQMKAVHTLTAITPQNNNIFIQSMNDTMKVLVISWLDAATYNSFYLAGEKGYVTSNPHKPVFVTVAPDMKKWYDANKQDPLMLDSRIEQLLGIPPNNKKIYFVELWVPVNSLFRPCRDNGITDNSCEVEFPADTDPVHRDWWNAYLKESFSSNTLYGRYPFTGLGYTYDWNTRNKTHIGLSEFCIRKGTPIYVNRGDSTLRYLQTAITK